MIDPLLTIPISSLPPAPILVPTTLATSLALDVAPPLLLTALVSELVLPLEQRPVLQQEPRMQIEEETGAGSVEETAGLAETIGE